MIQDRLSQRVICTFRFMFHIGFIKANQHFFSMHYPPKRYFETKNCAAKVYTITLCYGTKK